MSNQRSDRAAERRLIDDELLSLSYRINAYSRDIEKMQKMAGILNKRVLALNDIEEKERQAGLLELVKMCNTPAWSYKA